MSIVSCPECSSTMEEGFIVDRGDHDMVKPSSWVEGAPQRSFWCGTKTRGKARYRITTYRCGKCGFLKSYAREPKA